MADKGFWHSVIGAFVGGILAIYAVDNGHPADDQIAAFEKGVPSARVVRLPRANHYVYLSNEADVLREVNAFLTALSQ